MTEGGAGALAGLSQIPQATEDGGGTMAMLKKILPYLAAGGAVGLGAKLGGKDFMRGLGSGLQDLGPNMARARQEKEKRAHELAKLAPGEERDQASFEQELADSQAEALSQMGSKGLARQRDALIGQYGENVVDRAFNMAEEREAKAGREERQTMNCVRGLLLPVLRRANLPPRTGRSTFVSRERRPSGTLESRPSRW